MEARIAENKDPTNETLRLWSDQDPEGATINQLLLYLEDMDRFDVKDDLVDKIGEACHSDVHVPLFKGL